jgi:fatty acid desaturase
MNRSNITRPLLHPRDLQSIAYLVTAPALAAWQWVHGWQPLLYVLMLVLWIGVGVIHHHHAHRPMWRQRRLNRVTDLWIAALQGHPTFAFIATHNANHHRFRHGPDDWARTYRFDGGDTNNLSGWLLHPFQAAAVLYPHFIAYLRRIRLRHPAIWRRAMVQYALVTLVWLLALLADPMKAMLYVLLPQAVAMHWLLGANYFQHAHADGRSRWNYARNFEGGVNWLYFNIGFHTAHHEHARAHWSEMPALHASLRRHVDPRLNERSLLAYVARVFVAGAVVPRWRSRSLMALEHVA